jgi:hypothetical protein
MSASSITTTTADAYLSPLIECVGFPSSQLTANERIKFDAFVASQPPGALVTLRVYPNRDATSDDDLPSGMMAVMSPEARVDPTIIGDQLFQLMAVQQLPRNEAVPLTDEFFASRLSVIKGAVDQVPATRLDPTAVRVAKNNKERAAWAPEMGGPGSFVGVYSKVNADNHRERDYYIVGRATVPLVGAELKKSILGATRTEGGAPTYRDLTQTLAWSNLVQYGTYAARRNLYRGMQNVAEACGIEMTRVDDAGAHLADANHAPPEMAVPDWRQSTYDIRSVVYNGKPAVALTYGVVPAEDCLLAKDRRHFVASSPYDGIAMFELSSHERIQQAMALPTDTGRNPSPSSSAPIGARAQGITCEREIKNHPDLRTDAFRSVGSAAWKESMKQFGWCAEHGTERLVPVAVKIWSE